MVAYLQNPEGSEAFHQIVDFINTSHIKYALIENPKIYIFLIQQFWGTATARTTDDGDSKITSSIDGQVKTITEASLRRHLKLEDSDVADEAAFTSVDVDARGAATTDIGLEAGQGSGTMHKTPSRPHDSPLPRVYTLGSDEGKEPTELVEDLGNGEKGEKEISTANISVSTTSATLEVSTYDNRGLSRLHNQSIERDHLIGIRFVLDIVEIISFTFGDKEMILVIEAVSR
ncbi:hypothetical protein Tco_0871980 [Tanacetum coccineum]